VSLHSHEPHVPTGVAPVLLFYSQLVACCTPYDALALTHRLLPPVVLAVPFLAVGSALAVLCAVCCARAQIARMTELSLAARRSAIDNIAPFYRKMRALAIRLKPCPVSGPSQSARMLACEARERLRSLRVACRGVARESMHSLRL
jgi:hypothetical protein